MHTDTTCSCGEIKPHRIATRSTLDDYHVVLWSDGSLTWALGAAIRGAWCNPRPEQRDRALRAGWLVMGEVSIYDGDEVPALARAARWAAERDGLPSTMRSRLHRPRAAMLPDWTVLHADRDGKPTERVWILPRLGAWAGHAVWDYCSQCRGGRYQIMSRMPTARGVDGSRSADETYAPTGLRFETQAALLAWMAANPPVVH